MREHHDISMLDTRYRSGTENKRGQFIENDPRPTHIHTKILAENRDRDTHKGLRSRNVHSSRKAKA